MEQQLFDERLEEMDWYWDEVDRIMAEGTDSVLETMQLYLDDFNQASELQQVELLKGWEYTFGRAAAIGKSGASTMQNIIADIQKELNGQDIETYLKYLTGDTINTQYSGRTHYTEKTGGSGGSTSGNRGKVTGGPVKTTQDVINDVNKELNTEVDSSTLVDNKIEIPAYNGAFRTLSSGTELEFKPGNGHRIEGTTGKTWNSGVHESWTDKSGSDYNAVYKGDLRYAADWPSPDGSRTGSWIAKFDVNGYKGIYMPISKNGLGKGGIWWDDGGLFGKGKYIYKKGGMAYHTGPAWLDGTSTHPEAVLNAMQTKAFLSFTDDLAALRAEGAVSTSSSVTIDSIAFNVESMSSVADGEKAFNAFVDKFKEIGAKQGISVLGTANRN
jgi:hypothetical protein